MSMDSFSDHLVSGYQPLLISDGWEQSACISDDELAETNPLVFQEKQSDLMMVLRERVQNPHLGHFAWKTLYGLTMWQTAKENPNPLSLLSFFGTNWTISLKENKAILISPANTTKKV